MKFPLIEKFAYEHPNLANLLSYLLLFSFFLLFYLFKIDEDEFKPKKKWAQSPDNKEPIDEYTGVPLSEWMEATYNMLQVDAVGLWEIIPILKDSFGLYGEPLIETTREVLLGLFARGAEPVVGTNAKKGWHLKNSYGNTPEEKTEAIIQEWLASGEDPIVWNSLWFTLPDDISEFPGPGEIW